MTFDTRAFRTALGSYPTGVAVVTTKISAEHHMGITVNSFTSVSLEPPLVLWCLDHKSDRYQAFTKADCYTVSVLGTTHRDVSSRLASRGNHSLDGIALRATTMGPPALADALAVFECESQAVHDAGDHAILIGRVLHFARREDGAPLVFYRGKYSALEQGT